MKRIKQLVRVVDGWQRRHRVPAIAYGVVRKFGDDQVNLYVVSLGWYGFTAIYPLLLAVVTVLGFIGVASLGQGILHTLQQFPVIGSQFKAGKGSSQLHGSTFGLVVGLVGLIYGAQGVTQVAQQAMAKVWNVTKLEMPGFVPSLIRSLLGLVAIGGSFFVSAFLGSVAVSQGRGLWVRILIILGLALLNVLFFWASFVVLTPKNAAKPLQLLPGAILGGLGFTLLTTVGTGLIQHQLRNTTATYGALASVIGVVVYLLFVSKLAMYAAELNPVIVRRLWPRALPTTEPTQVDNRVLADLVHEQKRRPDEQIGVDFRAGKGEGAGATSSGQARGA